MKGGKGGSVHGWQDIEVVTDHADLKPEKGAATTSQLCSAKTIS